MYEFICLWMLVIGFVGFASALYLTWTRIIVFWPGKHVFNGSIRVSEDLIIRGVGTDIRTPNSAFIVVGGKAKVDVTLDSLDLDYGKWLWGRGGLDD